MFVPGQLLLDDGTDYLADFGLSIARTQRLHERECHTDADFETWLESKRVFRTLLTCEGYDSLDLRPLPLFPLTGFLGGYGRACRLSETKTQLLKQR